MKKIALYGGSFDPPHLGHVMTIAAVLNSGMVDEVWLVPTGKHRDKNHQASPDHRKEMISIVLATMFGSKVPVYLKTLQIDKPWITSTTLDLLERMNVEHPDHEFNFVVGSDLVKDIPSWANAEKLTKQTKFLVVQRLQQEISDDELPEYAFKVPTKGIALTNISSSLVRGMIQNKQSLEGVVPPAVISHIIRNDLYVNTNHSAQTAVGKQTILEGKFIKVVSDNGWEYVARNNCDGVVVIAASTMDGKILFTEQYRKPVGCLVIELPAGLVGDTRDFKGEVIAAAAKRELLEETGYAADRIMPLIKGPASAGLSSEIITFVKAEGLKKMSEGGGDDSEDIKVHEIELSKAHDWLQLKQKEGLLVDPKVYAGLFFLQLNRAAV